MLALLHLLLGESLFGIYLVQWLLLALSAAIIGSLTTTLFGQGIGAAGFIAALAFNLSLTSRWTVELASENLFIPLLCLWTLWLSREIDKPGSQTIAGGAVLLGFTTLARSTLLTAWPFSFWASFAAYRRARRPLMPLLVLALLACATLGTATVRNWIVSHQLTPLSTSGSVALQIGNPIPPDVPQHAHDENLFYRWVASDTNVRTTLEFARHAPARFLRGQLDKMYDWGGSESSIRERRASIGW